MRRPKLIRAAGIFCVLVLSVGIAVGCGGGKSQKGDGESEPQGDVVVDGKVSLRGSTPFTLLLLEGKDGTNYMIESSRVADELKQLEGMDITVTAKVLPHIESDAPALSVRDYDMLPLPTGERPIVGVITSYPPDIVYLNSKDGTIWSIKGDFRSILLDYTNAKVWVVGDRLQPSASVDRGDREIYVTQYGVIKQ
jgi:hypothetical protein